jgi:hypothetical protein
MIENLIRLVELVGARAAILLMVLAVITGATYLYIKYCDRKQLSLCSDGEHCEEAAVIEDHQQPLPECEHRFGRIAHAHEEMSERQLGHGKKLEKIHKATIANGKAIAAQEAALNMAVSFIQKNGG